MNNVLTGGCASYGVQSGGHNQQLSGNIVYDISNPTAHNTMIKIVTKKGGFLMNFVCKIYIFHYVRTMLTI